MMPHLQEENGKFLWLFLQSLDFHVEVTDNKTNKHLNLGMNMFDKPNKEAFYIVIHFLFKKLNPSRVQDAFRHCWPVFHRKADAEFRKVALGWLQEIANEAGSNFPKVVASHLLSASGPRFVNLMLHLAKHVMVKKMKTFTTDGTWVPEAAAVPSSSQELAVKRFQVVKRHFQRVCVKQDSLIQDYKKRAKHLEKSLRDNKAEEVYYNDLLKKHENNMDLEREHLAQIHHKVQMLWVEVDTTLSSLEEKQTVLDSVIQGKVDQYALDGKSINMKIPTVLLERMERLSQQTNAGSLYEEDQPVLLRLMELLTVALSLLSEERAMVTHPPLRLSQHTLQEQALLMNRSKETLKNMRRKLAKEAIPQTKSSIKKLEVDWEKKWAECLIHTPLISFLNEDPVLDFISPMAHLSFEPASEASFKASIFSQYPAKIPESVKETPKEKPSLMVKEVEPDVDFSRPFTPETKTEDLRFSRCVASPRCRSPYMVHLETPIDPAPAVTPIPSSVLSSHRKRTTSQTKTSAVKPKASILELEYENLANQFAEAVTMSPVDGKRSGMDLELFLNTLSDPFTTKKQLPRTPESLIMDVRASWRKAVEEGKAEKKHKVHDSLSVLMTPVSEAKEGSPSLEPLSLSGSTSSADPLPCSPPPSQQGTSLHSTVTWDSSQLEAFGQSSSNIIQLSINHETFPDMENDSFNTSDDQLQEVQGEMEELVLPPVASHSPETDTALQMARKHFATLSESPFTGGCKEMESDILPSGVRISSGLSSCGGEKVFSLDLDQLESFSSPLRDELTLPNLVTFSPMDEL